MNGPYYDGTKLLSMTDINGNKPELYLCTSNRTAGKTTYFGRLMVNRFIDKHEKFGLIYRFNYELDDCAEKFFKDLNTLFFPEYEMTSKRGSAGSYHILYLNGEACGYAMALNMADQIKKQSHLLSDIERMLFEEFQSETNHYCANEVAKFISIHTSVARGNGKMTRYVPVYMIGNAVTIINPYYLELGISDRLKNNTKFLRGDGFVLEQAHNEAAAEAQQASAFNRAFSANKYVAYAAQNIYLNDNTAFIEKPSGNGRYVCTLRYDDVDYAIREYQKEGIVYCDNAVDATAPVKIVVTTDDHRVNYIMLKRNDITLAGLRFLFEKGAFRFKNLKCKEAVLKALSYKV